MDPDQMTSSDPADLDLQYFKGLISVQHKD